MSNWFNTNGGHNREVERAVNILDSLLLNSDSAAEQRTSSLTDFMDQLDLAQVVLPVNHKVLLFTKGAIGPDCKLVASKIGVRMQ